METKCIFDEFTNKYGLSKTLRFELKPVGKTVEWIEKNDIIGVKEDELIGKDAIKATHYKYAKRMLDAMHRLFIEDALFSIRNKSDDLEKLLPSISSIGNIEITKDLQLFVKNIFDKKANEWIERYKKEMPYYWQEDLEELKDKFAKEDNKQRQKGFTSAIKAVERNIAKPLKDIKKNGHVALFSNTEAMKLLEWKVRTGAVQVSFKDLEQSDSDEFIPINVLKEYLLSFNKFYSYFSGFNENRANVYDLSGDKSTSIIYRTFAQNFAFHLANIEKWERVCRSIENYQPAYELLEFDVEDYKKEIENNCSVSFENFFTLSTFATVMSQSGIDMYNTVLGGKPALEGGEKIQGVNEFINICRQKAGGTRAQFPPMQEFYKQILSKSDHTFIPEFSDDKDLLQSIKDFYENYFYSNNIKSYLEEGKLLTLDFHEELDVTFIAKDKVSIISNALTGNWNNINSELLDILDEKAFHKRKYFSILEIERAIELGQNEDHFVVKGDYFGVMKYFSSHFESLYNDALIAYEKVLENGVLNVAKINSSRSVPGDIGFEQVAVLKAFLDACVSMARFVRDWGADKEIEKVENRNRLWYEYLDRFVGLFPIIGLYNMTRNYLTKKPGEKKKIKVNFEKPTLLDGWARKSESANLSVILSRNGNYFLGIMDSHYSSIFDYQIYDDDSLKKQEDKLQLSNNIIANSEHAFYSKLNYEQIASVKKDIYTLCWDEAQNKAIRKTKGREKYWGERITRIKEDKTYVNSIDDRIIYFSYLQKCAKDYWKKFNLDLKDASEYSSLNEMFNAIESQGYSLSFDKIKAEYIDQMVEEGKLYLFQIYNKDFSANKKAKGTDNLHTMYWKQLFSKENLKDVVLKLNGQAEIFFRPASVKYSNEKMQKGHHADDLKGKFSYPIIKDKRFTEHKFFFHCPIGLNFKSVQQGRFNDNVLGFLKNNADVNVIGIDRGEKHLLYYSVINQKGEILDQGSLNQISNGFVPRGEKKEKSIDYHAKLDKLEEKRDEARKNWSTIENIKELKSGYLSQVVHKLSQLIIHYNAIVVLEDLNIGFKRGRFGVEKQVYQKFEKALIEKLNYLVFKNSSERKPGGVLNAYQLTDKFVSFQKMGKQSGILFYTTASYTSTTDPVTGFLKNVYTKYQNLDKAIKFWKSFDSIVYNEANDRFEFTYTLGNVNSKQMYKEKGESENQLRMKTWTVCSCVTRSHYIKAQEKQTEEQKQATTGEQIGKKGKHVVFCVNDELKKLLDDVQVDYRNVNLKDVFASINDVRVQKSLIYYFNAIMTMRVTDSSAEKGTSENDFILSPVEPFFDSRKASSSLPENGDANGAYNIARKGICILNNINEAEDLSKVRIAISKMDWQNFAQQTNK